MKIITTVSEQINDNSECSFLLLENLQDLQIYQNLNQQIKSKDSINFWIGFKSQTFRNSALGYAQHEAESGNTISHLLAYHLDVFRKGESTSMVEYCDIADSIIANVHQGMMDIIENRNSFVRINKMGGYCPIDKNLSVYHNQIIINEQEMCNYLLHGEINVDFSIQNKTLVIENDGYLPVSVIEKFTTLTGIAKEDLQIITDFKHKTLLFKSSNWITFFENGIKNGLENIVFETSAQDIRQINELSTVLDHVIPTGKVISVYVKSYNTKLFESLTYKEKINIIFL